LKTEILKHLDVSKDPDDALTLLSLAELQLVEPEDVLSEFQRATQDSTTLKSDSILIYIIKNDWVRVLDLILENDDFTEQILSDLTKAVFICAERGHCQSLARLLYWISMKKDKPLTFKRRDGTSALHVAAQNGQIEACRILVEMLQMDVNDVNNIKQTPLMFAVGYPDTVQWFLSMPSIELDLHDSEGSTAFMYASQERSSVAVCVMGMLLKSRR